MILKMGKMGHFEKFELKKVGHFKKLTCDQIKNRKSTENEIRRFWGISKNQHVINFDSENEPKVKFFDFGAFQKIRKML